MDRNETIKAIRTALQRRSGKQWSVKGGRGTAWGWIHVNAPPARCTFSHRTRADFKGGYAAKWSDQWEEYDTGEPGHCEGTADRQELAKLLEVEFSQTGGGIDIPAQGDYYQEYIDRAEGRAPSKIGVPYWD